MIHSSVECYCLKHKVKKQHGYSSSPHVALTHNMVGDLQPKYSIKHIRVLMLV